MPDWHRRWIARKIMREAAYRGQFYPTISAYGNSGVWSHRVGEMEFQASTEDEIRWMVMGKVVFR